MVSIYVIRDSDTLFTTGHFTILIEGHVQCIIVIINVITISGQPDEILVLRQGRVRWHVDRILESSIKAIVTLVFFGQPKSLTEALKYFLSCCLA